MAHGMWSIYTSQHADWQENLDIPCDTGSTVDILAREYIAIDFNTLASEYPDTVGRYAFS